MNEPEPISGLLLIDKPLAMSSMQVCARVRGRFVAGGAPKRVKVGHAGTLDPLATGLLVILVGRATRLCEQIMRGEKEYIADIDLAHASTTDDHEGVVTATDVQHAPSRDDVEAALARFVGDIRQTPPAHSAMKVGGKRAYALARAGKPVDLEPRTVRIDAISVLSYEFPLLRVMVRCGKGTYIRSLARDIGRELGVGGMLDGLRRTRIGPFLVEEAMSADQLPRILTRANLLEPPAAANASA